GGSGRYRGSAVASFAAAGGGAGGLGPRGERTGRRGSCRCPGIHGTDAMGIADCADGVSAKAVTLVPGLAGAAQGCRVSDGGDQFLSGVVPGRTGDHGGAGFADRGGYRLGTSADTAFGYRSAGRCQCLPATLSSIVRRRGEGLATAGQRRRFTLALTQLA